MILRIEELTDWPKDVRVHFADTSAVDVRRNQFADGGRDADLRAVMVLAAVQRHAAESDDARELARIEDAAQDLVSRVVLLAQRLERLNSPLCGYWLAAAERPTAERGRADRSPADRLTRPVPESLGRILDRMGRFAEEAEGVAADLRGCELFRRVWPDGTGVVEGGGPYQGTELREATAFHAPGEKRPPLAPPPAKKARPRQKASGKPTPKPKAAPRPAGKRPRQRTGVSKA